MDIKVNDVYSFRYKDTKDMFMPHHCFDGQLLVRQKDDGELFLQDTYWGWKDNENKRFTLERALECGILRYVCNLDDIEICTSYDLNYYNDEDLFNLSYQHGCYKRYCKKLGAKKSANKIEKVLKEKISSAENNIEFHKRELKFLNEKLEKLKNGNMDICI